MLKCQSAHACAYYISYRASLSHYKSGCLTACASAHLFIYLSIYLSVSKPHYSLHPPQTLFYIVSEDENAPKRLLPGGSEGELWIGGVGVAAGYLNAPDLTKEVLVLT